MRPLRIGINALFRGRPTGVANYIINLIKYLAKIDEYNEYYVYVTESNRDYFNLIQHNLHEVVCSVKAEKPILRRAWEQTIFPYIVSQKKLDILHCPVNVIPIYIRCKCVVTFLDCQYFHESSTNTFLRKSFHKIFMRKSLKKADIIMTISNSMKGDILHYLGDNGTTICVTHLGQEYSTTIDNPVNPEIIKRDLGISRKYILFVGFPSYRKNLTGLLKGHAIALKKLQEPYDLIICGDVETKIESDYPNILRTIEDLKIKNYVKFTSYLEKRELQGLITGAEFLAFPSLYEGFGLPVIEAMACETPVLVSDIPVMREIAGDAGAYINPYDVDDISRGICKLLLDDDLKESLSIKGKCIASGFTWEKTARKTLECYQQTVKENIP